MTGVAALLPVDRSARGADSSDSSEREVCQDQSPFVPVPTVSRASRTCGSVLDIGWRAPARPALLYREFFLAKPARASAFLYDGVADMHKAVRS